MARHESDREDLYQELHLAQARWEIARPEGKSIAVAAIRDNGRFVLYFSPDEMYQFDSASRLLRSYQSGYLFRTQGATLARLQRQRTETVSELLRHDLTPGELSEFLGELLQSLQVLLLELQTGHATLLRTSLPGGIVQEELCVQLERCLAAGPCLAPPYPTRRK